jgi:hypothetical protein
MGDWSSGQQQDQWSNYGGQDWQAHQQSQEFHTQSQDFQQFDYGNYGQQQQQETDPSNPYLAPNAPNLYTGSMFVPDPSPGPEDYKAVHGSPEWEDEPPLLEELGIHPDHILQKTLNVLNPMMTTEAAIAGDSDLAGPIVFALAFGSFIMFSGKLYFNYIYGIGLLGCLAMYALLNLMSLSGVSFVCVVSVLGYCLLPLVGLSGISVLFSLSGLVGNVVAGMAIFWCTVSASKLFVTALEMKQQQLLVAYPCFLLYGVFALITMF